MTPADKSPGQQAAGGQPGGQNGGDGADHGGDPAGAHPAGPTDEGAADARGVIPPSRLFRPPGPAGGRWRKSGGADRRGAVSGEANCPCPVNGSANRDRVGANRPTAKAAGGAGPSECPRSPGRGRGAFAADGQTWNDSPQPQLETAFGLLNRNPAPIRSST